MSQELLQAVIERARAEGRDPSDLIGEAVREYLVSVSITDASPGQVAESQLGMIHELGIPPYQAGSDNGHETS